MKDLSFLPLQEPESRTLRIMLSRQAGQSGEGFLFERDILLKMRIHGKGQCIAWLSETALSPPFVSLLK